MNTVKLVSIMRIRIVCTNQVTYSLICYSLNDISVFNIINVVEQTSDSLVVYHIEMYNVIYSEWSSLEKEMGDGLQKSGHYMDR